jgi:hypothetical protein
MLATKGANAKTEDVGMGVAPPRREPAELDAPSFNVKRALETYGSEQGASDAPEPSGNLTRQSRKRLMQELKYLAEDPHPAMDVFPSESNLAFWKVIMTAPSGMTGFRV